MIGIQQTINLAPQVELPFAYRCTPLCASWTKNGTLEHNYSLLQL